MIIIPKKSNTFVNITMALIYILYGVIKIVIGIAMIYLPPEKVAKIPILKNFTKESADKTVAGRMYEYILMAFGVVTILHGLIIFGLLPMWFEEIFVTKLVQYSLLYGFGLIMTIFYILVLYTDIPISKDKDGKSHYFTLGLIGGILFLISPPLWEFIEYIFPFFNKLSMEQQNMVIVATIIIITIIAEFIYLYVKKTPDTDITKQIIVTRLSTEQLPNL